MESHIKFSNKGDKAFDAELKERVGQLMKNPGWEQRGRWLLYVKAMLYFSVYFGLLIGLLTFRHDTVAGLMVHYVAIGVSGILLTFNVSHDAAHRTFSRYKWINDVLFHLSFNLQGVNAYLWGERHKASHHVFPNVDGCDADIDENPVIRLSPTKALHYYHRFQNYYSNFIYCIYITYWVLFKEWIYFSKKRIANLRNIRHRWMEFFNVLIWKVVYFSLMLVLPVSVFHYSLGTVVSALFINQIVGSLIFIFTLIISHLTLETDFPVPDQEGRLPYSYMEHQLATSLDYYPCSKAVNFFLGGFNSHAAHHLFPHLPHTLYCDISPVIIEIAEKYHYPYHQSTLPKAIVSHFSYLKKMGNATEVAGKMVMQ
ncbi:MAG: acyl-CoA desaturase [Bacteroidia bacterium]